MKIQIRHLSWYFIAALLLCLVCATTTKSDDTTPCHTANSSCQTDNTSSYTSLCEKENDTLNAVRKIGQWGLPSSTITLQGTTTRALTFSNTLQRIIRAYNMSYANIFTHLNETTERVSHIVSAKQFHAKYYIYYRCQMRC